MNNCNNYVYDGFGRLSSATVNQGQSNNFTYVYDRWGNRWEQNALNGGPAPQFSFNTGNNQITNSGYSYDAAGNLLSDGTYTYTYDADGNMTSVAQGGTTIDTYTYNASNQRVRIDDPSNGNFPIEFFFNPDGQHTSSYMDNYGWEYEGWNYWGDMPVAFYADGAANFEHQDWLGTERMRTTYNGQVQGSFTSLPFGDAYTATGNDWDARHFAGLDYDWESDTYHAQYRQYSPAAGRWMSPDLYSGSYDPANPQSFNRYSYVLNDPLAFTDPSGQDGCSVAIASSATTGIGVGVGATVCAAELIGGAIFGKDLLGWLFGGPSFHGSLKPRPNNNPWSEYSGISYGPDIAGALGLPDEQCDFGVCGGGPMAVGPGNNQNLSIPKYENYQPLPVLFLAPYSNNATVKATPDPPKTYRKTGLDWWKAYGSQIGCEIGAIGNHAEGLLGSTIATGVFAGAGKYKVAAGFFAATVSQAVILRHECVTVIWGPGYE